MVARNTSLPRHIEPDSIVEAVMEVRFDAPTILPEVLFGRLAEHSAWSAFQQRRLPAYEIPAPLREADVNLRFAPIFELAGVDVARSVRIGPHSFSYHARAPYPGWLPFQGELHLAIDELCQKTPDLSVKRLGMRYLNALRSDVHGIDSPAGLDLEIRVSNESQTDNLNLNYIAEVFSLTRCTVRIATRDFVQGPAPSEACVFVDVDVFTDQFSATDASSIKQWAAQAHEHAKREFFHLLKDETIQRLKRD